MDERKNKMTDEHYREILPVAYMTAAIMSSAGYRCCVFAEALDK